MNNRIQELIEQATIETVDLTWGKSYEFDREKFAELIIRECAQIANDSNQSRNRAAGQSVGDVVIEHFGVK